MSLLSLFHFGNGIVPSRKLCPGAKSASMGAMKMPLFTLFFLVYCALAAPSYAKPLRTQDIAKASRIGIMTGTFDPVTNNDLRLAHDALVQADLDLVIIVPSINPIHKSPISIEARLAMIDKAAHDDPSIAYPFDGPELSRFFKFKSLLSSHFSKFVREINPKAQMFAIPSDESASTARATSPLVFLRNNQNLYFEPSVSDDQLPPQLDPAVARYILAQGLYLDSDGTNTVSTSERVNSYLTTSLFDSLSRAGIFEDLKQIVVRLRRNPSQRKLELNGHVYSTKKYLGSGLTSDAYIITIDGQDYVLKMAKPRKNYNILLRKTVLVQKWAKEKDQMAVPTIYAYDEDGAWTLSEFISGPSLPKYIEEQGGFKGEVLASLQKLYAQVQEFKSKHHLLLDFGPDNIILSGDEAYLVDLGTVPRDVNIGMDFQDLVSHWTSNYVKKNIRSSWCLSQIRNLF